MIYDYWDARNRTYTYTTGDGITYTTSTTPATISVQCQDYIYDPFVGLIKKDAPKPNYSLPDVEVLFNE